jgi:hypothetical protein
MVEVIHLTQNSLSEGRILWRAAGALSLGMLLGALVAVPYDRVLNSAPPYVGWLYAAVQSLIAAATFVRAREMDVVELVFEEEPDLVADP